MDTLVYLLGSRYCETDRLTDFAWSRFGNLAKGWPLVQAIFAHAANTLDFRKIIDDRGILLVNLRESDFLSADQRMAIASLFIHEIWTACKVADREDFRLSLEVLRASGYDGPLVLIYDGPADDEWAGLDIEYAIVRDALNVLCQHIEELRVPVDEPGDQPGAGDPVDLRAFAGDPFHAASPEACVGGKGLVAADGAAIVVLVVAGQQPLGKSVEPRLCNSCAQCGEPIFMPEWSEYLSPRRVRHLWECEACGYRFETLVIFPGA